MVLLSQPIRKLPEEAAPPSFKEEKTISFSSKSLTACKDGWPSYLMIHLVLTGSLVLEHGCETWLTADSCSWLAVWMFEDYNPAPPPHCSTGLEEHHQYKLAAVTCGALLFMTVSQTATSTSSTPLASFRYLFHCLTKTESFCLHTNGVTTCYATGGSKPLTASPNTPG